MGNNGGSGGKFPCQKERIMFTLFRWRSVPGRSREILQAPPGPGLAPKSDHRASGRASISPYHPAPTPGEAAGCATFWSTDQIVQRGIPRAAGNCYRFVLISSTAAGSQQLPILAHAVDP